MEDQLEFLKELVSEAEIRLGSTHDRMLESGNSATKAEYYSVLGYVKGLKRAVIVMEDS